MRNSCHYLVVWGLMFAIHSAYGADQPYLSPAIHSEERTEAFRLRDAYRHPEQTLNFFEVKPNHSVVEIWPGGGWYTEILAPYLKVNGTYYAAGFAYSHPDTWRWKKSMAKDLIARFSNRPDFYGYPIVTEFEPPLVLTIAPANSVDRVLTFRNVHNWMKQGAAQEAFDAFYQALKPGGILGVVEHRAEPDTSLDDMITSGYVTENQVIRYAKNSGFMLLERSEINANPKDTKNHPKGVWTLPPSLRLGDERREHYLSIGESDRMTLKFLKP